MTKERIPLMSVIMPVYNAAEYLEQTLLSVLGTYASDIELIAIDDGSTDNSLAILERYQKAYNNLFVFSQKNSGPSAARNKGLSYAKGEYVFFLDADDLLEVTVLRNMCEKANEESADMVIASYDIFNEYRTFSVPSISKLSERKIIPWNARGILWTFSLCNKVFRREKIEELHMRFPKTNYSEDGVFVMGFVYHAEKIIGYNDIVFHYRRMTVSENKSITSSVNETKVKDYLLSHEMIYDLLKKKCLEMNPEYTDFDIMKEEDVEVNDYANEFLKKEISILFNQFYKLFWSLDEQLIELIVDNLNMLLKRLDVKTYYEISANMPELSIRELPSSYKQAMETALVSIILYADKEDVLFEESILSLSLQRFVQYKLIIPYSLKEQVEKKITLKNKSVNKRAKNKSSFYREALKSIDSKYVLFADPHFVYDKSALLEWYKLCEKMQLDFITSTVYLKNEERSFPSSSQGRALLKVKNWRDGDRISSIDGILGNKLIRADFIRGILSDESTERQLVKLIYKQGYFAVTEKCYLIYGKGDEQDLTLYLSQRAYNNWEKDKLEDIQLSDSRFLVDQIELYKKIRTTQVKKAKWKRDFIYKVSRLPVRDRVLFFSIRRDGELDDNLKCVEAHWNGKKIVASKMLPHDNIYKLKMYYYIATSKVIVTDDYIRYLRLFPLKKEQRVIQLWHACGAFKKFGIQGTTLSLGLERATHIQYNFVSVSAEGIRQIYANAFDIDKTHVVAMGVPRTDVFFDQDEIEKRSEKIFARHPEWKNKEIIVYAPTFRDKTGDRSVFKPELDFERLSLKLKDNQIFVIAPHPVMKTPILDKKYSNIFEERDIHTMDLMFVSSQLITDYSSVIFEYCLLKKPIVFFCYDLEMYDRGFYLSYDENLPGELVRNQEELEQYLSSARRFNLAPNYDKFVETYMGACDGKSTERIVRLIADYMREKEK